MKKILALLLSMFIPSGCNRLNVSHLLHQSPTLPLVILITGQSNGSSYGHGVTAFSETGRVKVYDPGALRVNDWVVPTRDNPISFDISWIYLGDMIARSYDRDVWFVNQAYGNTNTFDMQSHVPDIVSAVSRFHPDFVLWIQGESDRSITDESHGYANMKAVIDATRSVSPRLPWFVALDAWSMDFIHPFGQQAEQFGIRQAQRQIIADGVARQGPDIDLMRYQNLGWFEGGGAEMIGEGLYEHARLWFNVLQDSPVFD